MATDEANKIATSQIALPKDVCDHGLRHRRLRPERPEPEPGVAHDATWSSATTAASTSSGRCRARSPTGSRSPWWSRSAPDEPRSISRFTAHYDADLTPRPSPVVVWRLP